jgi:phosphatidylserine/phosphatidylglycerophosphate/cardiolipin synthase-like enzyme
MDTDGAGDWRNANGQVVYPGWELERFEGGVRARVGMTVALAPDGSWELAAEALRGARESVELESYTLDHAGIGEVLAERAGAGVRVRVLLDGDPVGGLAEETKWVCEKLEAAGGECWFMRGKEAEKIAKRYRHLHAKFAVIDGERVLLGSENYGKRGMPDDEKGDGTAGHRGVVGLVESREAAEWVRAVWESDKRGADVVRWCAEAGCEYGPAAAGYEPVRESGGVSYTVREPARAAAEGVEAVLATSPEGHLSVPGGVLEWIARAGPGDEILVQQLREALAWGSRAAPLENPRLRALIDAAERGADVRIMLDGGYDLSGVNADVVTAMQELGLPNLRAMTANPTGLGVHNKMLLLRVGGARVVHFGSWNGSETSALMNREMSITALAPGVHRFLRAAFLADWRGVQSTHLPLVMHEARYEPHLLISELMIDPIGADLGGEWIEIYNAGYGMASLSGVRLGDAFTEAEFGPGDGQVEFPAGAMLPGGGVIVIAQDAIAFRERYGRAPDYEIAGYDEAVPDLLPVTAAVENGGEPGVVNLSNAGDVVALSADVNRILDIVAWRVGDIEKLRSFDQPIVSGVSLQRWPANADTEDCAVDFRLQRIPSPGRVP